MDQTSSQIDLDKLRVEAANLAAERDALEQEVISLWQAKQGLSERAEHDRQQQIVRALFEQSPDPMHYQAANGRITTCNPFWLECFGYERSEVVGHSFSDFLEDCEAKKSFFEVIRVGAEHEIVVRAKNGTKRDTLVTIQDIDPSQPDRHMLVRMRDVTNFKHFQQIVGQQEKMASLGVLAAGVAHEINNPMGFISSMLNTLGKYTGRMEELITLYGKLETAASSGDADAIRSLATDAVALRKSAKIEAILENVPKLVGRCKEGCDRVKSIVSDLRSFARTDDNAFKPLDVREVIESSLNIAWNELKYKATVEKSFDDVPNVTANAGKLSQVFINILVNAAHAIEKQGTVTIRVGLKSGDSDWVTVAISDTGSGIQPENIPKLFDPFFTTKAVGKGTGLGLHLAFNIMKEHQGQLRVESQVGAGTTFYIDLPTRVPVLAAAQA